jgi:hypothetical protein
MGPISWCWSALGAKFENAKLIERHDDTAAIEEATQRS